MTTTAVAANPTLSTGTNIDINSLVSQLMAVEEQPLQVMQQQVSSYQSTISAYGQLQSTLSSLGTATNALQSASTFNQSSAAVSNASVLSATTAAGAASGTYSVVVQQLAQTQQLASGDFSSASSVVGTGTLTFQFGTSGSSGFTPNSSATSLSVTINSSNNTLSGIAAAINQANGGVQASVVSDGTGYRLALAPTTGGINNTLKVSVADSDGNNTDASGLSQLAYDPAASAGAGQNLTQVTAAQNGELTVNGIAITSTSNSVTPVSGLTLSLNTTNVGSPVTVTVTPNTSAVSTAINAFVTAYNTYNSQVGSLTAYTPSTGAAGALQGDSTTQSVINQINTTLTAPVQGLAGGLTSLAQIGVTLQSDGSLAVNSTQLNAALANPAINVASLFTTNGTATNSAVSLDSAPATAAAGNYAIAVTQPATQGSLTGSAAAPLTITAGVNDTLNLTVDGQATTVTLTPGTYANASDLAAQIQSAVNGSSPITQAGVGITVTQNGGVLSIDSNSYGSGSSISGLGGTAASLFGSAPASTTGVDIAGSINGIAATGKGQILIDATTGLRVQVAATAAGSYGNLALTLGYGATLGNLITSLSDPTSGPIATADNDLNQRITNLNTQETAFNSQMTQVEANYRAQFSALDASLSQMKTTSSFLTQQLASISSSSSSG